MFLKHTKWAIAWGIFIFILCAIPGKDIPEVSVVNFDKFIHASLFFILILLTTRGFNFQNSFELLHNFPKVTALIICIAYGGLLEIFQGTLFVDRSADIYDFYANSTGCLIGILLYSNIDKKLLGRLID